MPAGRNSSKVLSQPSGKSDVVRSRAIERVLLFFMTEWSADPIISTSPQSSNRSRKTIGRLTKNYIRFAEHTNHIRGKCLPSFVTVSWWCSLVRKLGRFAVLSLSRVSDHCSKRLMREIWHLNNMSSLELIVLFRHMCRFLRPWTRLLNMSGLRIILRSSLSEELISPVWDNDEAHLSHQTSRQITNQAKYNCEYLPFIFQLVISWTIIIAVNLIQSFLHSYWCYFIVKNALILIVAFNVPILPSLQLFNAIVAGSISLGLFNEPSTWALNMSPQH